MAITFDPTNKIVQLDSTSVSAATIWSRWVDYAVLSDNSKYGAVMTQLGGVAPVDLYIFMENGWRVRPLEADGVTTITGNLLVTGGGSPIAQTLGNFNVLVNMETPVKASAIEVSTGGSYDDTALISKVDTIQTTIDANQIVLVNEHDATQVAVSSAGPYNDTNLISKVDTIQTTITANQALIIAEHDATQVAVSSGTAPTVTEIVSALSTNLTTINDNVKKASLLIPASEDLS
jgi:hypothetical protein